MPPRRTFVGFGGGLLASAILPDAAWANAPAQVFEIHMKSDPMGSVVGFDPVGVLLQPGQIVRWICDANVHTATSYSPPTTTITRCVSQRRPSHGPPTSGCPGQTFEAKRMVEGGYDYFCQPHEDAGMVGRIIVGKATGPGTLPSDYFHATGEHWNPVPSAAQQAFPSVKDILWRKLVPSSQRFSA